MTIESAIKALGIFTIFDAPGLKEALNMAIDALRAQQTNTNDAVEGMCCDRIHTGPCCAPEENTGCEDRKDDGSCCTPYRPAKLDRSRWDGCETCKGGRYLRGEYCPGCGKPLTEETWAELERRIGRQNEP